MKKIKASDIAKTVKGITIAKLILMNLMTTLKISPLLIGSKKFKKKKINRTKAVLSSLLFQ